VERENCGTSSREEAGRFPGAAESLGVMVRDLAKREEGELE